MYLARVTVSNLRKIPPDQPATLELKCDLNLIIGENNVGKTTFIDLIAICLNYGSPDRIPFLREGDFHDEDQPIKVELRFTGLTEAQEAAFMEALVLKQGSPPEVRIDFTFDVRDRKIRPRITCGEHGATASPYDLLRNLSSVYLPPLRNVNDEFRPGPRNRVGRILRRKVGESEQKAIERIFKKANTRALAFGGAKNPVRGLEVDANKNIEKLSLQGDVNTVTLSFVEHEYTRILSNVVMHASGSGLDIAANGLGYNNLLYVATVLTELRIEEKQSPHAFRCVLIEEPEAHLHPQLQTLLLGFLQAEYESIQVILTSHSPTIVAATDMDNLSLLMHSAGGVSSILMRSAGLENSSKEFLARFLDVTKSQMFFARRIVFVEGITEALLVKAFWDHTVRAAGGSVDQWGIEVVNVQGVAFAPYIDIIKNVFAKADVRSVIISDDDRGAGNTCPSIQRFKQNDAIRPVSELEPIFDAAPMSPRASKLKAEVGLLPPTAVKAFLARKTFEVEFGIANSASSALLVSWLDGQATHLGGLTGVRLGLELWKYVDEHELKSSFASRILAELRQEMRTGNRVLVAPKHFKDAFEYLRAPSPVV